MSSTTVVAHLGVFRVLVDLDVARRRAAARCSTRRAAASPACRSIALTSEPGMSMWATESPNS